MNGIIWLASYPKSGNTWFRSFLTNLIRDVDEPADVNELHSTPIASSRSMFDNAAGIEASDLTQEEIERFRPGVYELIAAEAEETVFLKVHDAYIRTAEGRRLFPEKATKGTIYFIRNPLDVAVSLAHHSASTVQAAIRRMADPYHALCSKPDRLHNQLRQRLLTWSDHVLSWVDAPGMKVHVMRYEDMKLTGPETFAAAARFAGLPDAPDLIEKALKFSDFNELQRQEKEAGFRERSPRAESFFRKGEVGSWRESLTDEQVAGIIQEHREVMHRFGYLTDEGEAVY